MCVRSGLCIVLMVLPFPQRAFAIFFLNWRRIPHPPAPRKRQFSNPGPYFVSDRMVWLYHVTRTKRKYFPFTPPRSTGPKPFEEIYVIGRPGGPYWEKLCQRSPEVLSTARGRRPHSRPRAQFFPKRTDLGQQITCLLFSSVEYFVSSFCVEFSLQPFSNLVYACV